MKALNPDTAGTTLSSDLCPDFMEVMVRQASFPFHISQICLLVSSGGYTDFAFHTSRVLEVDLRQATILTT